MARLTRLFSALVPVVALAAAAEAAETGMLYVKSDPPGAIVVIAGEERGKTPVLVKGLPPALGLAGVFQDLDLTLPDTLLVGGRKVRPGRFWMDLLAEGRKAYSILSFRSAFAASTAER